MPHAIVYYGHYEHSFHRLHATQTKYWNNSHPEGEGSDVEFPKEDYTIEFGFLETFTKDFVVAKVNAIVLPYPIPFVWQRHGGKGVPVQGATTVDDDAAVALLSDAISFNPELRIALVPLLRNRLTMDV